MENHRGLSAGWAIELKHQRNPDVLFDTVVVDDSGQWVVPEEAYTTVETMLPSSSGSRLQLWASPGRCRAGWEHVVEEDVAQV
jgi:hypothetical protein